ncbi:hypothetical protein [Dactylosporangium sp. CA-233914]|uniref:hypothetical protein n=1 Tax=Dactylosporangium sp. CA-233914 TaxID=3239934 RepID=UPI003D8EFE17
MAIGASSVAQRSVASAPSARHGRAASRLDGLAEALERGGEGHRAGAPPAPRAAARHTPASTGGHLPDSSGMPATHR